MGLNAILVQVDKPGARWQGSTRGTRMFPFLRGAIYSASLVELEARGFDNRETVRALKDQDMIVRVKDSCCTRRSYKEEPADATEFSPDRYWRAESFIVP